MVTKIRTYLLDIKGSHKSSSCKGMLEVKGTFILL